MSRRQSTHNSLLQLLPAALLLTLATITALPVQAAQPPDAVNYQGVLRDGDGDPRNGTFDMAFRFFTDALGGSEILIDSHLAAGTGGVTVTDGLFSVAVGSGDVTDGSGVFAGDPFDSMSKAFGAFGEIWMQIEIDSGVVEVLSPRVQVLAAPFALNAATLEGQSGSDFLNVGADFQTKAGDLGVNNMFLNGSNLNFSTGSTLLSSSGDLRTIAGDNTTDDLFLEAGDGSSASLGRIAILGRSSMEFRAGNGLFTFLNDVGIQTASLGSNGNLDLSGSLNVAGALISLGDEGTWSATSAFNWIRGNDPTDSLFLYASGDPSDGAVIVRGEGQIELRPGNGTTQFQTSNGTNLAQVSATGTLVLGMDSNTDDDTIVFDQIETLNWDDSQTRFEFSDSLALSSAIDVGNLAATEVSYNRFGTTTPLVTTDITNVNDFFIAGDLEVGDVAYVTRSIVVADSTATANQAFSSFGTGLVDSGEVTNGNDVYITDDLEVDGNLFANGVQGSSSITFRAPTNLESMIDNDDSGTVNEARWFHDGAVSSANQLAEIQESGNLRIRGALSQFVAFDVAESFLAVGDLQPGEVVAVDASRPDAVRRSGGTDDVVIGVVSTRPGVLLGGAPFDAAALRDVWGEAVHSRFQQRSPLLRQAILAERPDLQQALAGLQNDDTLELDQRQASAAERVGIESEIEGIALERFCDDELVPVALIGRVPVRVDDSFGAIRLGDLLAPSPIPGVAMRAEPGSRTLGMALADFDGGNGTVMAFIDRGHGIAGEAAPSMPTDTSVPEQQTDFGAVAIEHGSTEGSAEPTRIVLRQGEESPTDLELIAGAGASAAVLRVDENGNLFTRGSIRPAAGEIAELFPIDGPVEAGEVLVAAADGSGRLMPADRASDPAVVGVATSGSGLLLGADLAAFARGQAELAGRLRLLDDMPAAGRAGFWADVARHFDAVHAPVAVTGTVEVKADAGYGAIRPGDLLTTSPTPGHAMIAGEVTPGTILGKAIGSLDGGTGTVRMIVMLR